MNADGTHTLPPFFVDNAKRPKCFLGKAAPHYGFDYAANKNAWMRADLFGEWILRLDAKFES